MRSRRRTQWPTQLVISKSGLVLLLAYSACQGDEDEQLEGDAYEAENEKPGLGRRHGTD